MRNFFDRIYCFGQFPPEADQPVAEVFRCFDRNGDKLHSWPSLTKVSEG